MKLDSNWITMELAHKKMSPYKCAIISGICVLLPILNVDTSDYSEYNWIVLSCLVCIQYIASIFIAQRIYKEIKGMLSDKTLTFNQQQYILKLDDTEVIKDDIKTLKIRRLNLDELSDYGFGAKAIVIKGTSRERVYYVKGISRKYIGCSVNNLD